MPIMGIVQDSLLGVYLMTLRDTFITKAQIMNLVMWMDLVKKSDFCELPRPFILKPEPLWSGKQVISMLLP
jgi:DNA-directed RNA polymerase II subunit RPB1